MAKSGVSDGFFTLPVYAGTSFFRGQLEGIFVLAERRSHGNCSRLRTTFRLLAAETEINCPLQAMGSRANRKQTIGHAKA